MKKKWTRQIILVLLGLLLALPAAAETRDGVIWLEGMEEPIVETRFESSEGFAFWYASDMLATNSGAEGVVVSNAWSDDYMTLSLISEAEAQKLCADIARQPAERAQVDVYSNLEGLRFHFLSLIADNGHYLRAEGEYAMEAADGISKYFQRVLDTVEFTSEPPAI